jgi:hypothetical protein
MMRTLELLLLGVLGAGLAGTAGAQVRAREHAMPDSARGMMMGGPGMHRGPMAMMMGGGDSAAAADMSLVHELLMNHTAITRTVTVLPNGIRTVTASDNPRVAGYIISHVASMEKRLTEGRIFNLVSPTLPTIFQNKDGIRTEIAYAADGATVTQTSDDSATVAALKAHATEVSELVEGGMMALMRSVMAAGGPMGMGGGMGMMRGMGAGMMSDSCPMMGGMMRSMPPADSAGAGNMPMRHRP